MVRVSDDLRRQRSTSSGGCDHEAGICRGKSLPAPEQAAAMEVRRHEEAGCAHAIGVCNARPWQQSDSLPERDDTEPTPCPTCNLPTWDGLHQTGHRDCYIDEAP